MVLALRKTSRSTASTFYLLILRCYPERCTIDLVGSESLWSGWGIKGLAQGPDGDINLLTVGFETATFQSQAQNPNLLSPTPPSASLARIPQ